MRKRKRRAAQNLIEARIAQLQKNTPKPAAPLAQRDPNRPLWLPDGLDFDRVPLEVRQAASEIIQPAYEEMVRDAKTGMEKSLGASIVHLLWLEVLDQFDIKQDYVTTVLTLGMGSDRQTALNQYIRLLDAKLRVGNFLLRLRELRLRERKLEATSPRRAPTEGWSSGTTQWSGPGVRAISPRPLGEGPGVRAEGFNSPTISREEPAPQKPRPKTQDLSCKNEDLPTKKEPTESLPAAETWKNNQKAPKNPSPELAPQAPSPKAEDHEVETAGRGRGRPGSLLEKSEDQPCKNEDLMTKTEPADSHPAAETWKNNQSAPKNESEEFEDLEGKQMYANYLALFPEARSAPIIPDPRKKQGPKPSPYYSPK